MDKRAKMMLSLMGVERRCWRRGAERGGCADTLMMMPLLSRARYMRLLRESGEGAPLYIRLYATLMRARLAHPERARLPVCLRPPAVNVHSRYTRLLLLRREDGAARTLDAVVSFATRRAEHVGNAIATLYATPAFYSRD